jgi:hypothetical protein
MKKGAIRSALKFDYDLGELINTANKSRDEKPTMNIFSFLDNPNYQRQFEISPKFIRK